MTVADTAVNQRSLADSAGMIASIACAIHCAAMPFVISYLPLLGLDWLAGGSFHKVMAVICFALAGSAFIPGWRKHRSLVPVMVGVAGVMLLSVAAFGLEEGCCPSCETAVLETVEESGCDDESCPLCHNDSESVEETAQVVATTSDVEVETASWFIPFMTPMGGVLLVAGHLINHTKSCRCQNNGCCLTSGGSEETA